MDEHHYLLSKISQSDSIIVEKPVEDAVLILLKEVLHNFGDEWKKSFSYTFIHQQLEALTKNPRGMRWNPDVINFFSTISYYGGKKVYNILRGKGFEGQGKVGKLEMNPSSFNLHMPSLSALKRQIPKVDPYISRQLVPSRCKSIWKMFARLEIWENRIFKGGLVFDEIEICHGFVYLKNSQKLVGLASGPLLVETLGELDVDYKDSISHKVCQCFFVSNCGKICLPLHYFPTVSLTSHELFEVTEYLKQCLFSERIHVVWTSTDGFKGSLDYVTKVSTVCQSYHFFDYVHMVKLGRNQLLNRQLRYKKSNTVFVFSLKDLLLWWQEFPILCNILTLDDIHPSDKQDILPVKNLLNSIPKLQSWASDSFLDEERKNKCEGLCLYLQHFADLYELFSNNLMAIDSKIAICEKLKGFFTKWKEENGGGKSFISDDLYQQILVTINSFEFFFRPKLYPGNEENIVCTSILGTNIVENYFSIIRAKILYPNLWEYACVAYHAFLELVKRFSDDRAYSLPNRPLSRKQSMKYNDQSGIKFSKDDVIALCSIPFHISCDTVRCNPSENQILCASILALHYKCT